MAEELKPEALEPWKDRVLFHLSEIDGLAADSRGCYENARGNDSACYGQTEEIRKLLASVSELLAAARDVFAVKRPGYHDCLDDGLPECEWCLLEKALAKLSEKKG